MRRIAPAIAPVLALVAVSVPASPAHSSGHASATRVQQEQTTSAPARGTLKGIGLDGSAPGASFVRVSWNWIKAASGYRVQVAKKSSFSSVIASRKKRNSAHRPAGGREATTVGHLRDATYYWVRVRKVKRHHPSPWSSPVRVATKARTPDRITRTSGRLGPQPGSTTIHWVSTGRHTDYYRITTALSPFGSSGTPAVGRHSMTWKAPGKARNLTLSPQQTAAAGAGLGTGRHLFFRVAAVRAGEADTRVRAYAHMNSTTVAGRTSSGNSTKLRFGSYNLHVASRDVPGHPWRARTPLVARNLAKANPAVVALEEMMPGMWDTRDGGIGLSAALTKVGMGRYRLTRETPYGNVSPGETRILYDPQKVAMTSNCDPNTYSCAIRMPDPGGPVRLAAYARFKDLASGKEFWFVSAHLDPGNNAKTDRLRGQQAQAIVNAMRGINSQHLPVLVGADLNSSQTSKGHDAPHTAFLQAGYYNTTAAAKQINLQFNSVNAYKAHERPSNYGFGSMIDSIMTLGMPGANKFKQWRTGSPYPSDHNLITADIQLP